MERKPWGILLLLLAVSLVGLLAGCGVVPEPSKSGRSVQTPLEEDGLLTSTGTIPVEMPFLPQDL